jgi:hypothetical protein
MWVIYIVCFYIFYILLTQPFNPLQSLIVGVLFFIFMFKAQAQAQAETPSEPVGQPRTSLQ